MHSKTFVEESTLLLLTRTRRTLTNNLITISLSYINNRKVIEVVNDVPTNSLK